jgi:hypothetical protein
MPIPGSPEAADHTTAWASRGRYRWSTQRLSLKSPHREPSSGKLTAEGHSIGGWPSAASARGHHDHLGGAGRPTAEPSVLHGFVRSRSLARVESPDVNVPARVHVTAREKEPKLRARVVGWTGRRCMPVDTERLDERPNPRRLAHLDRLRRHSERVVPRDAHENRGGHGALDHRRSRTAAPHARDEERDPDGQPGSRERRRAAGQRQCPQLSLLALLAFTGEERYLTSRAQTRRRDEGSPRSSPHVPWKVKP